MRKKLIVADVGIDPMWLPWWRVWYVFVLVSCHGLWCDCFRWCISV